jgi:hypothetical protein
MAMILVLMLALELSRVTSGMVPGMNGAPSSDSSLSGHEIPAMMLADGVSIWSYGGEFTFPCGGVKPPLHLT